MKDLPADQGNRVRKGKLKAKLSRTRDTREQKEIVEKLKAIETPISPGGPTPPPVTPPVPGRPVKEVDLKDIVSVALGAAEMTGFPLKKTEFAEDCIVSGMSRLAHRKGWDMDQMNEWGLIGLGALLIIVQSVPGWITTYKQKTAEVKDAPKVRPDNPAGPDG